MNHADLDRRLAEANPVPQLPAVEASGLLAEITSLPPDPRVRPQRTGRRRLVVILVAAFVGVAVLSSTAFAVSQLVNPEDQIVKPQVTKQEYEKAQGELTLPPGYAWPTFHMQANSVTSPGAGGGYAVAVAMYAWEDYWVKAIRSDDSAAQRQAYEELLALLDDHMVVHPAGASENWTPPYPPDRPYEVYDADGIELLRKWFAAAAAGHPAMLEQIVRVNAPG